MMPEKANANDAVAFASTAYFGQEARFPGNDHSESVEDKKSEVSNQTGYKG